MKKKNSFIKFIFLVIFLGVIIGGGFIFISPAFEKQPPKIEFKNNGFWNLRDKLNITLSDETGIKYYKITFIDGKKQIILDEKILDGTNKQLQLQISAPKLDMFYKGKNVKIKIEAVDNSKWNFLNGNNIAKTYKIIIDRKRPVANVISNSRYISYGGSAVAIVKVQDKNLDKAYITFNDKVKFKLTPFYKDNYYIALIAWPVTIAYEDFDEVKLIAIDKALNKTVSKIPFYIQNKRVKKDNIKISQKFIKNVSTNVLEQMGLDIPEDLKDRFLAQNKVLRASNVATLRKVALKNMGNERVDNFNIYRFKRLRGSRTAAGFAELRSYYFDGEKIDEEWHLGMDWASVKHAPIKVSNKGKVIFNSYLGIYGNTIIIDHGMGLCSLYAHTTDQYVNIGDNVRANQKIATTGTTGAVMGDHLHFGILVQGIEVNPIEWLDRHWIKTRILDVIKSAKKEVIQGI